MSAAVSPTRRAAGYVPPPSSTPPTASGEEPAPPSDPPPSVAPTMETPKPVTGGATIRGRLILGFGAVMVVLVVTGVLGVLALQAVATGVRDGVSLSAAVAATVSRSQDATLGSVAHALAGLQEGATLDTRLTDSLAAAADSLRRSVLGGRALSTGDRAALERVGAVQGRLEVYLAVARAYQDVGDRAAARVQTARATLVLDTLLAEAGRITAAQDARRERAAQEVERLVAARRAALAGLLAAGLLVAGLFGWRTWRAVAYPLGRLTTAASSLARGDLRASVRAEGLDQEYALLAETFDRMAGRLRDTVGELQERAREIAAAAEGLTAASEQTASSTGQISEVMSSVAGDAAEQRHAFTEAEQALARVGESADVLTGAAARSRTLGREIRETSERTRAEIGRAIDALARSQGVIAAASERVGRVEQASQSLEAFVELVHRIASQSNLLALNAAIEAARAGDQGRGFSVVAQEVRELASRTAQSTAGIAQMVETVKSKSDAAVNLMANVMKEVEAGASNNTAIGQMLSQITQSAKQAAMLVDGIVEATREQAAASEDIAKHLVVVASISSSTATNLDQVRSSAGQMATTARDMRELVAQFKLD